MSAASISHGSPASACSKETPDGPPAPVTSTRGSGPPLSIGCRSRGDADGPADGGGLAESLSRTTSSGSTYRRLENRPQ